VVWTDNSLPSIEYDEYPEDGGYDEAGMHHWPSHDDEGGDEDKGELGIQFISIGSVDLAEGNSGLFEFCSEG